LESFRKSPPLALEIQEMTRSFPKEESWGVTSQLGHAVASMAANVAELAAAGLAASS